jgi:hypothetical protein
VLVGFASKSGFRLEEGQYRNTVAIDRLSLRSSAYLCASAVKLIFTAEAQRYAEDRRVIQSFSPSTIFLANSKAHVRPDATALRY